MDLTGYQELHIHLEQDGQVVLLELNHGKANECGSPQLKELERLVDDLRRDTQVRVLIVYSSRMTSSGKSVFISGANVTERVGWDNDRVKAHVRWQRSLMAALKTLPFLTIGVVDGLALGLGTELLLTLDWRLGTANALLGLPETGLGILPGALGTTDLAGAVGLNAALFLGITGETISGETARNMGFLHEILPNQLDALARARAIGNRVMTRSPQAVAAYKAALLAGAGQSVEVRQELEAKAYESLVDRGEAAIGRSSFHLIKEGKTPPWPPRDAV